MIDEITITGTTFFADQFDKIIGAYLENLEDGAIVLKKKLDSDGRIALSGRHTNYGYSGYVVGTIVLNGKNHRIINWRDLFDHDQNKYASQQTSDDAIKAAEEEVKLLRGKKIRKVRGGWEIIF